MPQMSPYNWLIMFIMFNILLIYFSCYNNFFKIYQFNKNNNYYKNFYKWMW